MKSKTLYLNRPDIEKRVYEDFPVTKLERRCGIERAKNESLRFERAKRYLTEIGKVEYETK